MCILRLSLLTLCCFLLVPYSLAQENITTDLQVLVDVSGSMKQTDPDNLRAPAIRLLAKLLDPKTRVGVWMFDEIPSVLVPTQAATDLWQKRLIKASQNIHTQGQFTNIQAALAVALEELKGFPGKQKNIIILSDGNVDVSKRQQVNQLSRTIIIKTFLPLLKQQGIKVHSIALSDNADHELLKTVSQQTGGWYEKAKNTQNINQIFLRLYQRSVDIPSLPLNDNKFTVDTSINDLTLIIFRKPGNTKPVRLKSPDDKTLGMQHSSAALRWHQEKSFDLITVNKPLAGEWRILGEIDPNNRALVVTNISLHVETLPSYVLPGEKIPLKVKLKHNEKHNHKIIHDKANYRYVLTINETIVGQGALSPAQEEPNENDFYVGQMHIPKQPGDLQVSIQIHSPTFARDKTTDIKILPLPIQAKYQHKDKKILFTPQKTNIVKLDSASLSLGEENQKVIADAPSEIKIEKPGKDPVLTLEGKIKDRSFHITHKIKIPPPTTDKPEAGKKQEKKAKLSLVFANVLIFNGILGIFILLGFMYYQRKTENKPAKKKPEETDGT